MGWCTRHSSIPAMIVSLNIQQQLANLHKGGGIGTSSLKGYPQPYPTLSPRPTKSPLQNSDANPRGPPCRSLTQLALGRCCRLSYGWYEMKGRPLYSSEEMSALLGYLNRRNAHNFGTSSLRPAPISKSCGRVSARLMPGGGRVLREPLTTPLAAPPGLMPHNNARLGRADLTAAKNQGELAQISYAPVLQILRRQLAASHRHYQEAHLLAKMLECPSHQALQLAC